MDTHQLKMTNKKLVSRLLKRGVVLAIATYLYWPITVIYILTGLYDVFRQKKKDKSFVFIQYFMVNGILTWVFSPINTLIDILCLPYINKQVYKLEDLPKTHQEEIKTLLEETPMKRISDDMNELSQTSERTMMFYKWYGYNVETEHSCELFHRPFKKILTIGVSNFKANASTKVHFGWLRAGVRVLINIDEAVDERAYIDVNDERHVWKTDGPLFIFDDTIMHQSYNLSDQNRNCLFIDVVRPSLIPVVIKSFVKFLGFMSINIPGFNKLSNWKVVK